jgi:Protein of unknown function (DUF1592)/Protein of unknown function (DUF1588)/Protein of unknown function (DUF1585)/Protein of unknown function (DUF1595)
MGMELAVEMIVATKRQLQPVREHAMRTPAILTPLFLLLAGCTGYFGGISAQRPAEVPAGQPTPQPMPQPPSPTVGENGFIFEGNANLAPRLRLKSNAEVLSAVQEVFGLTVTDRKLLPPEGMDPDTGFSNMSDAYRIGENRFIALQNFGAVVSAQLPQAALLKFCSKGGLKGEACAKAFIEGNGRLLLARNMTEEEKAALLGLYTASLPLGSEQEALKAVAEALLQLPSFLYRTEAGQAATGDKTRLTPFETAAALASFLWESPPDEALLAAAASGKLSERDEVERQARRMIADPKARPAIARFVLQWLDIRDIELQPRDVKTFPGYSLQVVEAMLQETAKFAEVSVLDGDSSLSQLLAGKKTHLNKTLSDFYGFGQVKGDAFEEVSLPDFRAGVLTQGSFNIAHAGEAQTSPIKRGSFVRRRILCQVVAPAPADAPKSVAPASSGQTIQDLYRQDRLPGCQNCHKLMNPIGFGFENIDAVGRTRTTFNALPIDSSGEIFEQNLKKSKPFAAGVGLFETLATMREVSDCFTLRLYQFALGRPAGVEDKMVLDGLAEKFRQPKATIKDLMVDVATSPAFLQRNAL